jgi:excisionase family DNA binding protein
MDVSGAGQLLTLQDVRESSRLSTSTLRAWVKSGLLPAIKLGRSIRIEEAAWRAFVAKNRLNGGRNTSA